MSMFDGIHWPTVWVAVGMMFVVSKQFGTSSTRLLAS